MATALGHYAGLCGYRVRYYNVLKLFEEILMARVESCPPRVVEKLAKTDPLLLVDFSIMKLSG